MNGRWVPRKEDVEVMAYDGDKVLIRYIPDSHKGLPMSAMYSKSEWVPVEDVEVGQWSTK